MSDILGRPWAKTEDIKEGDIIEVDNSFPCIKPGKQLIVKEKEGKLFVSCLHGDHLLEGQLIEDEKCYIGMYKA